MLSARSFVGWYNGHPVHKNVIIIHFETILYSCSIVPFTSWHNFIYTNTFMKLSCVGDQYWLAMTLSPWFIPLLFWWQEQHWLLKTKCLPRFSCEKNGGRKLVENWLSQVFCSLVYLRDVVKKQSRPLYTSHTAVDRTLWCHLSRPLCGTQSCMLSVIDWPLSSVPEFETKFQREVPLFWRYACSVKTQDRFEQERSFICSAIWIQYCIMSDGYLAVANAMLA